MHKFSEIIVKFSIKKKSMTRKQMAINGYIDCSTLATRRASLYVDKK